MQLLNNKTNAAVVCLELAAVSNKHLLRSLAGGAAHCLDSLDDIHALYDGTEHDVFAIEPTGHHSGDEELGTIGAGTSVGHA